MSDAADAVAAAKKALANAEAALAAATAQAEEAAAAAAAAPAPEATSTEDAPRASGPLTEEQLDAIRAGYVVEGAALEMGAVVNGEARADVPVRIPLAMTNR